MPFDPAVMSERLQNRDYDFFIPKKDITEVIFNRDEIIFNVIRAQKKDIPDLVSFLISAMGTSGLDEYDMSKMHLVPTNKKAMLETIFDFQYLWKLDLEIEKYIKEEIRHIYQVTDTIRTDYDSEICFMLETEGGYIYFFTHHFYY